ncbi:MAG: hypothetical protein GX552_16465 [Chloroflexi bacterium]|nr:hypothetical protein [Chloroflexota bacterium]
MGNIADRPFEYLYRGGRYNWAAEVYTVDGVSYDAMTGRSLAVDYGELRQKRYAATDCFAGQPGWYKGLHVVLDVVGFVPVIGDIVDLVHGALYVAQGIYYYANGNWTAGHWSMGFAAASAVSAVPLVGDVIAKGGKYAAIGGKLSWKLCGDMLAVGARRAAIQYGMQYGGGYVGKQIGGERGEQWGRFLGGLGGGLTNAGLAWRSARSAGRIPDARVRSANRGVELFNDGARATEVADPALLRKLGSRGYVIDQSPEIVRYLDSRGANAGTFLNNDLLLRPGARKLEVLEEYLHNVQHRIGLTNKLTPGATGGLEMHVKDFMLRHRRLLGISDADATWIEDWLTAARKINGG